VKAVGEPIVLSIVKHHDRRELGLVLHRFGVVLDKSGDVGNVSVLELVDVTVVAQMKFAHSALSLFPY
jgi:hypothetical protein